MSGPMVSRSQTADGVDFRSSMQTIRCVLCEKTDKLSRCSRCKSVFYCTKEHQRRDWKRHKEFCGIRATWPNDSSLVVLSTNDTDESHTSAVTADHSTSRKRCTKNTRPFPNLTDQTQLTSKVFAELVGDRAVREKRDDKDFSRSYPLKLIRDSNNRSENLVYPKYEDQNFKKKQNGDKSKNSLIVKADGWTSPITYEEIRTI